MTIDTFISQLCEHCGLQADSVAIEIIESEDDRIEVKIDLPEEDSGLFIGYHGETLDAIQRITRLVFFRTHPDKKISVNINGYREDREEKLREMVMSIGIRVLETGESYTFNSFLPANERYIIHSTLSEEESLAGLESISEGNGRDRRLTIRVK
ncbi:MAG: KH domain-containing protein [Microgenomates group bacterium]